MKKIIFSFLLFLFFGINLMAFRGTPEDTSGDRKIQLNIRFLSKAGLINIPAHSKIDDIYDIIRRLYNLAPDTKISIQHQAKDFESFPSLRHVLERAGDSSCVFVYIGLNDIQRTQIERQEQGEAAFSFPKGYENLERRSREKLAELKSSLTKLNNTQEFDTRFYLLQELTMNAVALIDDFKLPPEARVHFAATLKDVLKLPNDFFDLVNVIPLAQNEYFRQVQNSLFEQLESWSIGSLEDFYLFLRIRLAQEYLKSQIFWDYVEGARQQPVGTIYESPLPPEQLQSIKDYFIALLAYGQDEDRWRAGQQEFDRQVNEYVAFHNAEERYQAAQ